MLQERPPDVGYRPTAAGVPTPPYVGRVVRRCHNTRCGVVCTVADGEPCKACGHRFDALPHDLTISEDADE